MTQITGGVSEKNWIATLLLCFFLGSFGIHHFYAGKVGLGITQLLLTIVGFITAVFGGFVLNIAVGIWVLVDFIMIIVGSFKDKEGNLIKNQ